MLSFLRRRHGLYPFGPLMRVIRFSLGGKIWLPAPLNEPLQKRQPPSASASSSASRHF